ncbi:hypothetical protein SEUCBS139899_006933 [Sporothrix eucalyptigena]|uniref:Dead deah box DNA helicase n=1 Tax=Sporothrix eucalyptigena TaxID=1812306 RepID=A0ABP0CD42_9PEZI
MMESTTAETTPLDTSPGPSTILADNDLFTPDFFFDSATGVFDRLLDRLGHPPYTTDTADTYVVGRVSADDFQALKDERDERGRKFRFFFLREANIVIVTIPTGAHEQMHVTLSYDLDRAMTRMGVENEWEWTAAEAYTTSNGSEVEGDATGGPTSPGGLNEWPTLVIESGYSQSIQSLRNKAMWWFHQSGHRMKVVLLIKMNIRNSSIHIEKWTERAAARLPGARTTRLSARTGQAGGWQAECRQIVDILWTGPAPIRQTPNQARADPALYHVAGGPLTISFADIFLRPPVGGEHDFVVTVLELQRLAARAWKKA